MTNTDYKLKLEKMQEEHLLLTNERDELIVRLESGEPVENHEYSALIDVLKDIAHLNRQMQEHEESKNANELEILKARLDRIDDMLSELTGTLSPSEDRQRQAMRHLRMTVYVEWHTLGGVEE